MIAKAGCEGEMTNVSRGTDDDKEEKMKRYIVIPMVLMLISLFVGCATTSEERKEEYELRKSVGTSAFVGSPRSNVADNWRD